MHSVAVELVGLASRLRPITVCDPSRPSSAGHGPATRPAADQDYLPRRSLQDHRRHRVRHRRLGRLVQQPSPPRIARHDDPRRVREHPLRDPQTRAATRIGTARTCDGSHYPQARTLPHADLRGLVESLPDHGELSVLLGRRPELEPLRSPALWVKVEGVRQAGQVRRIYHLQPSHPIGAFIVDSEGVVAVRFLASGQCSSYPVIEIASVESVVAVVLPLGFDRSGLGGERGSA